MACSAFGSSCDNPMYCALIVNPSTGKVITKVSFSIPRWDTTCSGFAYDGVNDDYKLVVVEYVAEYPDAFRYRKVLVYSMKSNPWRLIETTDLGDPLSGGYDFDMGVPLELHLTTTNCVLINNYLMHWLLIATTEKKSIVCFDLENEQWTANVPLPDYHDFKCDSRCTITLGILDGCLCLSVQNHIIVSFDVWIMKEYRAPGSWTRFKIAVPNDCDYSPVFAYEHAAAMKELLVTKSRRNRREIQTYVWLNLSDKTAKRLHFCGAPKDRQDHLLCVGTLATGCGNLQSQKCKETKRRLKIDNQVKLLQANAMI